MLYTIRTVAPVDPLLTLADAKAHCRVDHSEDDTLLSSLISAVTSHLDGYAGVLGRALVTQTWRADYAGFDDLRLPLWPVASVTSVTYIDGADASQTISAGNYELGRDGMGAFIAAAPGFSWPQTAARVSPVSVTAVYGTALSDVPNAINAAALLLVGDLYRNRETVAVGGVANVIPMSATVDALLAPYRRVGV
jgi:uncharacterized phiE125 gp8 family phage protein